MSRIAIPVNGGRVSVSLENAPKYFVYETDERQVISVTELPSADDLLRQLRTERIDAVLCGSVTNRTRRDLALCGITLYGGIYGEADDVVRRFLEGTLDCLPDTMRSFHAVHYTPCAYGDEH